MMLIVSHECSRIAIDYLFFSYFYLTTDRCRFIPIDRWKVKPFIALFPFDIRKEPVLDVVHRIDQTLYQY